MSKFCPNCGFALLPEAKFCPSCGAQVPDFKLDRAEIQDSPPDSSSENKLKFPFPIKNKEKTISQRSFILFILFSVLAYLPFLEETGLSGFWAVTLIGGLGALTALIVFILFRSRAKKMQSLISGDQVLASWELDAALKAVFIDHLFTHERSKNKVMFFITVILITVIFGLFIAFIEDGKVEMALVGVVLIALLGGFAFLMPSIYRSKNLKGDGIVLIGKNFAYINGFFHNWDFALSGITKCKVIKEPFHGIYIQYYYTDRTLTNTEELQIPAPRGMDLNFLVRKLKK